MVILVFEGCTGCRSVTTIRSDREYRSLELKDGKTIRVLNDAMITVRNDATINGKIVSDDSRLELRVGGDFTLNGTLQSTVQDSSGQPPVAFSDQDSGLNVVVGGRLMLGNGARLLTNGSAVFTNVPAVLSESPASVSADVNSASGTFPTLVPLPPDNPAFAAPAALLVPLPPAPAALPPHVVSGEFHSFGEPVDEPVLLFHFEGPRDLEIGPWRVEAPPGASGPTVDNTDPANPPEPGSDGKRGMDLKIWNDGGEIRIVDRVVLMLSDGGDGSSEISTCEDAEGFDGGEPGNFRMTASEGIHVNPGLLDIHPGAGGNGGDATVTKGAASSVNCAGQPPGDDATAKGGDGADNRKQVFARGNVSGIDRVYFMEMQAGHGGEANANACDGGNGDECCDGGDGGVASATGGNGGDASFSSGGLPVNAPNEVNGGEGGPATAIGGNGGAGGDCKFEDGGNGGAGGNATATGGSGGDASGGDLESVAGDSGDADATGGRGGDGGDCAFGTPGSGGEGGTATADTGRAGSGSPGGDPGTENQTDGEDGEDGAFMAVNLFCFGFEYLLSQQSGLPVPATIESPLVLKGTTDSVGTGFMELATAPDGTYAALDAPVPHLRIESGTVRLAGSASEFHLDKTPHIGGLELAPLFAEGLSETAPIIIEARGANGDLLAIRTITELPDNRANFESPESVVLGFDTDQSIETFVIIVPAGVVLEVIAFYLIC